MSQDSILQAIREAKARRDRTAHFEPSKVSSSVPALQHGDFKLTPMVQSMRERELLLEGVLASLATGFVLNVAVICLELVLKT